MSDLSYTLCE
jgi:hypothetical protein